MHLCKPDRCRWFRLFVECMGTDDGLRDRFASQPQRRLEFYREMYENCTTVSTNLELVHLYPAPGSDYDLSFLENIREVRGYVLIGSNLVSRIPLTSLRIIRGLEQFRSLSVINLRKK